MKRSSYLYFLFFIISVDDDDYDDDDVDSYNSINNMKGYEEEVGDIVSGCEVLAKTEYIPRHNNSAEFLHVSICKVHDLEITDKWYQPEPAERL